MNKLKNFDTEYGWIIRWLLMIGVSYAILYADNRYTKSDESDKIKIQMVESDKKFIQVNNDINNINQKVGSMTTEMSYYRQKQEESIKVLNTLQTNMAVIQSKQDASDKKLDKIADSIEQVKNSK